MKLDFHLPIYIWLIIMWAKFRNILPIRGINKIVQHSNNLGIFPPQLTLMYSIFIGVIDQVF